MLTRKTDVTRNLHSCVRTNLVVVIEDVFEDNQYKNTPRVAYSKIHTAAKVEDYRYVIFTKQIFALTTVSTRSAVFL